MLRPGTLLLVSTLAFAAEVPQEVKACVSRAGSSYQFSKKASPGFLRADFNGDGKPDYAVIVMRDGSQGVVVCAGDRLLVILGAGTSFNGMRNLDFTSWKLHPKAKPVPRGASEKRPPALVGDALYLEWESASAIVYWKAGRFLWYQQGD